MKKVFLALSVVSALSASKISDDTALFLKSLAAKDGIEIEVVKTSNVPNSDFEMIEFNIVYDNKIIGQDVFFSNGKLATPTLFDMHKKLDLKADFIAQKEKEKTDVIISELGGFLNKYSNVVINLGSHPGNAATVVFTDPDCPWCRKHLETIRDDLQTQNIKLVLLPLPMHIDAMDKSIEILEKIKNKKTDEEKIKLLEEYFTDDVKFKKADKEKTENYEKIVKEIFEMGVRSTPSIFQDVKVK